MTIGNTCWAFHLSFSCMFLWSLPSIAHAIMHCLDDGLKNADAPPIYEVEVGMKQSSPITFESLQLTPWSIFTLSSKIIFPTNTGDLRCREFLLHHLHSWMCQWCVIYCTLSMYSFGRICIVGRYLLRAGLVPRNICQSYVIHILHFKYILYIFGNICIIRRYLLSGGLTCQRQKWHSYFVFTYLRHTIHYQMIYHSLTLIAEKSAEQK